MKRILLILAILLTALTCLDAQKTKQNYVIGFYNLENLFDTYDDPVKNDAEFLPDGANRWTEAKYRKKLSNMAHVIAEMAKSNKRFHTILGVSEIENRLVLEDLVCEPEIASANYQIVHYESPDRRGVDVALLYRPDQFTLLDSESIPFTFEKGVEYADTDTAYFRTRDILMVHGLLADEEFAFYVCHLPSRVGGKGGNLSSRGAQIAYEHAMKMMEKHPDIKIVVMGDMNDNPTDDSQAVWLHGRRTIEETRPGEFFDPFTIMLEDGYGSLAYQGEWNIYDIIQVNYNLAVAPQGGLRIRPIVKNKYYGRVFKKPFMTQQSGQYKGTPFRTFSGGAFIGGYSDHYPTYIVISK